MKTLGMKERKMCRSKRVFQTLERAQNAVRSVEGRRDFYESKPLYPYQCPICEHYHLTTQPQTDVPK